MPTPDEIAEAVARLQTELDATALEFAKALEMPPMKTREVRLTEDELDFAMLACMARRRELERRLKRSTFKGKPGMREAVVTELSAQRELEHTFRHAWDALRRQIA